MKIHVLSGFLGSGKTTAIYEASKYLIHKGKAVGVITNDQGSQLVDSGLFESSGIPNSQVLNGCFCCNYDQLTQQIDTLTQSRHPDYIFAESVGSCTDIMATVIKPLLKYTPYTEVTLSTIADIRLLDLLLNDKATTFQDSVSYIYFKQLEEASVIVVTKVDLVTSAFVEKIVSKLRQRYPGKTILFQDNRQEKEIQRWLNHLDTALEDSLLPALEVDYDTYAAGEAALAWLDQSVDIYSEYDAGKDAIELIQRISQKLRSAGYGIGHLKFLLDGKTKISLTHIPEEIQYDQYLHEKKPFITLLLNARVETTPERLRQLVQNAIQEVETTLSCYILTRNIASFQPGYPAPIHRIDH